jgi:hypothetical protein
VVPGASSAALLAASLALRFLVLASEVIATVGNQVLARRERRVGATSRAADAATAPDGTADRQRATGNVRAQNVPSSPASDAR